MDTCELEVEKPIHYIQDFSPIEKELAPLRLPSANSVGAFLSALLNNELLNLADRVFGAYPTSSLITIRSRSLLYFITHYLKPQYALEIGTYMAGSSEIVTRALRINGKGKLITIDPFGQERVPPILNTWPESLRKQIDYLPLTSMNYFIELERQKIRFDLSFIDGDHSFEYALYDLQMASRHAAPGAIIIMDNVEQTGVYWAVKTFLSINPDWQELGSSISNYDRLNPYTTMHPSFPETSFLILQGPSKIFVGERPRSFQTNYAEEKGLSGFVLSLDGNQVEGVLNALIFFRSFWHGGFEGIPKQMEQSMMIPIKKGETKCSVELPNPFVTGHVVENSYRTYEIVLSWIPACGEQPLELTAYPEPVKIK